MIPREIKPIVLKYKTELLEQNIEAKVINPRLGFSSYSKKELLMYAHHLCDEVLNEIDGTKDHVKMNRQLAAIQICLMLANLYTVDDIL